MVDVAQLVRVTDCGSEGRGFEPHLPPAQTTAVSQDAAVLRYTGRPSLANGSSRITQNVRFVTDVVCAEVPRGERQGWATANPAPAVWNKCP